MLIVIVGFSASASAEFYVWYDELGVKRVSTHPAECIGKNAGNDSYIKHNCAAIVANSQRPQARTDESNELDDVDVEIANTEKALKKETDILNKLEKQYDLFVTQRKISPNDIGAKRAADGVYEKIQDQKILIKSIKDNLNYQRAMALARANSAQTR
jgi:hypothetical protein